LPNSFIGQAQFWRGIPIIVAIDRLAIAPRQP
jgi:hypothetical protein